MLDYKLYSDLDYHHIYINASKELIEVFRNEIVELHHIGSTSIEGVSVVPSVEILPVVKDLNKIDNYVTQMKQIGYSLTQTSLDRNNKYLLFTAHKNDIEISVLIIERTDCDSLEKKLAVRDYLRTHNEARIAYKQFKQKLNHFTRGTQDIQRAEDEYLKGIEAKAIYWYRLNK